MSVKRPKLDASRREIVVDPNLAGGQDRDHVVADPGIASADHGAVLVIAAGDHDPAAVIAAGGQGPGQENARGGQGLVIVTDQDAQDHALKGVIGPLQESATVQRKASPQKSYCLQP